MRKYILLLAPLLLCAHYDSHIYTIPKNIKKQMMTAGSWKKNCPVPMSGLRYLTMTYRGFDKKDHKGEMIVNSKIANEVTQIFGKLYKDKYPIRKMKLVSKYGANDFQSIEADNTSAFNCRPVTGGHKWSKHSYGKAIDINPLENPYISRSGKISHKRSLKYRSRKRGNPFNPANKAVILRGDNIVKYFKSRGWRWGGDWNSIKDYQHFDKR